MSDPHGVGERDARIAELEAQVADLRGRMADVKSDRNTWKDRAIGCASMLPGSMVCGDVQEAAKAAAELRSYAEQMREFVEMVAEYEGDDPLTTDYSEIVRDLGEWARECLAKNPNPAGLTTSTEASGRHLAAEASGAGRAGTVCGHEIGEVLDVYAVLEQADEWIAQAPHGDNCFVTDDPPEFDVCQCGKDTIQSLIEEVRIKNLAATVIPGTQPTEGAPTSGTSGEPKHGGGTDQRDAASNFFPDNAGHSTGNSEESRIGVAPTTCHQVNSQQQREEQPGRDGQMDGGKPAGSDLGKPCDTGATPSRGREYAGQQPDRVQIPTPLTPSRQTEQVDYTEWHNRLIPAAEEYVARLGLGDEDDRCMVLNGFYKGAGWALKNWSHAIGNSCPHPAARVHSGRGFQHCYQCGAERTLERLAPLVHGWSDWQTPECHSRCKS